MVEVLLFILFSVTAVASALYTVTSSNILRGALSLIVTFFCAAALFVLLSAELLAAIQIIVYAGAIMVLILFVIFLTGFSDPGPERYLTATKEWSTFTAILLFLQLTLLAGRTYLRTAAPAAAQLAARDHVARFAETLFMDYLFPFELLSIALLAALVATLHLARRKMEVS